MKRLNSRQVEAFRAVMMLGSMTRAAELLEISQPAVSRLIMDLQLAVGFQLFTRRRHGTVPTEDARRLQSEVDRLFMGLDELNRRAHAIRNVEMGELRIAAPSLYGNSLLPQIIAAFLAKYPGIQIALEICPHQQVIEWLASHRCDIGLTSLPAYSAELTIDKLAARSILCVMPADSPLTAKPIIDVTDLAGVNFVSFPPDAAIRFQIDTIFDRAGVQRELRVEAGTHEAVCNLVAAGVGVSLISPFSPSVSGNPRLAFRPFNPAITLEIGLLTDEAHLSIASVKMRDFIIDYFRRYATAGGLISAAA
jgi:DNA-binding transcriptional LysR family regulator